MKNRKKRQWLTVGILCLALASCPNIVSAARIATTGSSAVCQQRANEPIKDFACDFIINVFSDFADSDHYDLKDVDPKSEDLIRYIRDKKEVIKYQQEIFNLQYKVKQWNIQDMTVTPLGGDQYEVLARIFYQYDDIRNGSALNSGAVFTYKLIVQKQADTYKVVAAISDDLASGNLMGDVVVETFDLRSGFGQQKAMKMHSNKADYDNGDVHYCSLEQVRKALVEAKESIIEESVDEKKDDLFTKRENIVLQQRARLKPLNKSRMKNYMDNHYFQAGKYHDPANGNYDCTNYASNVLYAGGANIDKTGRLQWYPDNSTWIRVNELRPYLINNTSTGPVGVRYSKFGSLETGDLIQMRRKGDSRYKHTVVVYNKGGNPWVTAHSGSYSGYFNPRYTNRYNDFYKIHIKGTY